MKLMIAGSRSIKSFDLDKCIPSDVEIIITGGASGVDALAEQYADSHNISKLILRPKYSLYKKSAPLKRNEEMINIADEILVIWDGISKGSEYTIKYAKRKNKPLTIIKA